MKQYVVKIFYDGKMVEYDDEAQHPEFILQSIKDDAKSSEGWIVIEDEHKTTLVKYDAITSIEIVDVTARD